MHSSVVCNLNTALFSSGFGRTGLQLGQIHNSVKSLCRQPRLLFGSSQFFCETQFSKRRFQTCKNTKYIVQKDLYCGYIMAASGSTTSSGDLIVDSLISSCGNVSNFAKPVGVYCNDRVGCRSFQKSSMRLKRRGSFNNRQLVQGYFIYDVTQRSFSSNKAFDPSSNNCHASSSPCYSDGFVPDMTVNGLSCNEQLATTTTSADQELYSNNISGPLPSDLGNLTNLVSLDLYMNSFSGRIPDTLGKLTKLRFLRLNNNSLSGAIPVSLTKIKTLQVLDLSNNHLSGPVPANGTFSLFTPISFANNLNLCGPVTGKPCPGSPPLSPPPFIPPLTVPSPGRDGPIGAIVGGVAVGAALLCAAPAMAYAWWQRRKPQERFFDVPVEDDPKVYLGQLKRFSLNEIQVATDNFSSNNILGRGGFGKVYKGRLVDGSLVAVKRLKEERTPGGELQFQTEIEMISMAVHRNLLRLRGFCVTPTERLLVYPYMAKGSVASCLRERLPSEPPLDWPIRKKIALGSARGLSYLHDSCDPKIIHRDVKAANILLDEEFEAVVGDFGLAKLMDCKDTHVTTAVRGTVGHIAPEYFSTGKSSEKTDVFGYGIMLLELITGQRAFDLARIANSDDVMFVDWVKGLLKEKKLEILVDPELQNNYVDSELEELIQVALLCTQNSPMDRPKMSEVVRMLEGSGLAEKWEEWQKAEVIHQGQEIELVPHRTSEWILDSTNNLPAEELSGPR